MWTPTPVTPSATPVPNEAVIVDTLNGELRGADPLEETLDARFFVTDVGFLASGNPSVITTMQVLVECEWAIEPSCTEGRAFIALLHAFHDEDILKPITEQIPATIEIVQVNALDHMSSIGSVTVHWHDVVAFANGGITGDQLAARVTRSTP